MADAAHWDILVEPMDEGWAATLFLIDADGESGDGVGFEHAPTPGEALARLAETTGDRMLCAPDNPWCEYSEEAVGPEPSARTRTICLAHPGLFEREVDSAPGEPERVWTFFGHWEGSEILLDLYVEGEHEDTREQDDSVWPEGLWCDSGRGKDPDQVFADLAREYEREYEEEV